MFGHLNLALNGMAIALEALQAAATMQLAIPIGHQFAATRSAKMQGNHQNRSPERRISIA
jgi:hypothetical protein